MKRFAGIIAFLIQLVLVLLVWLVLLVGGGCFSCS